MNVSGVASEIERKGQPSGLVAGEETGPKVEQPAAKDFPIEGQGQNPVLAELALQEHYAEPVPKAGSAPAEPAAGEGEAGQEPKPAKAEEGILLNFDNADIYEFIQAMAQALDLNYIIDPAVKGVVNIRSAQKISADSLYAIFKKILNINGLDIRNEGSYYYIYAAQKPFSHTIRGPEGLKELQSSPRMVIQVLPVSFLASAEALKLIQPFLSERGMIFDVPNQNTIILSDFESKVVDSLQILSLLDVSSLAGVKARLIRVEKAPLFDLREELTEILTAMNLTKAQGPETLSVVALERVNALLLISRDETLIKSAEKWVKELDVSPSEGRDNVFIYTVRNSVASDLADFANKILGEGQSVQKTEAGGGGIGRKDTRSSRTSKGQGSTSRSSTQQTTKDMTKDATKTTTSTSKSAAQKKAGLPGAPGTQGSTSAAAGLGLAGEPLLIADDDRNIVVVRALPADYPRVIKMLERLDNMPRQVLIEVLVAEITLSKGFEFGVEWWARQHQFTVGDAEFQQGVGTNFGTINAKDVTLDKAAGSLLTGLNYTIKSTNDKFFGLLRTIAKNTDVTILSSPQVLVLNNETATVNVGKEVPIITDMYRNLDATTQANSIGSQSVQYKDVGVILEVSPKINSNGIIIIDVSQQVNDVAETDATTGSPIILKREVQTKLAVKDGQSILMGGLISKKDDKTASGIPYLMDAPLLGWLFKYKKKNNDKTELVIMISPHVIDSEEVLDQYTKSFSEKVSELKGEF